MVKTISHKTRLICVMIMVKIINHNIRLMYSMVNTIIIYVMVKAINKDV